MVQPNKKRRIAPLLNSTGGPRFIFNSTFGSLWSPNRSSLSLFHGMDDPQPAYWLRFPPDGTSTNAHQGVTRGATLLQNSLWNGHLIVVRLLLQVRTCAHTNRRALVLHRPYLFILLMLQSTLKFSRLKGNVKLQVPPFSHQTPCALGPAHFCPGKLLADSLSVAKCHAERERERNSQVGQRCHRSVCLLCFWS